LVTRAARAGPVAPVAPEDPVDPVVRVGPAAQDRADLAARVTLVDPADMNRVVAATVGTAPAAVMAPADLASRAVPVVRVGMILEDQVGMIPEDPEGTILGDPGCLGVPNPVVRVDPASRAELARVGPGSREATDLSLGRARLGRMLARRDLTPAHRPTAVARPWEPTLRAEATRQEARTRLVAATLLAEAIRPVGAIRRAETRRAEATAC
jgi:hypothetical protein